MLAVHKTQDVRNGQVVVARIDEEVTVKRLKKQGNVVELLPENSEVFPDRRRSAPAEFYH
ncbi:SOS-response repressor and protease LexA [Klebsiella pneumoniae subsp. pneumoniae]|nr:SOS-response repressor and protease LexA [Klebsiella pneumoniae subsp. pneumoniae]